MLAPYAADNRFFGAALIAIDGKPVLRKGYGFANPMQKIANTPETGYQIASITKTFTASLIMQLRDEGKLSIDDPASTYLSGYPNLERDGVAVTIKQLLSHTSGVVDFLSLYDLEDPSSFPPDLPALIDNIKRQPLEFTPGSDYLYSNSGYLFLGRIIEQITGSAGKPSSIALARTAGDDAHLVDPACRSRTRSVRPNVEIGKSKPRTERNPIACGPGSAGGVNQVCVIPSGSSSRR